MRKKDRNNNKFIRIKTAFMSYFFVWVLFVLSPPIFRGDENFVAHTWSRQWGDNISWWWDVGKNIYNILIKNENNSNHMVIRVRLQTQFHIVIATARNRAIISLSYQWKKKEDEKKKKKRNGSAQGKKEWNEMRLFAGYSGYENESDCVIRCDNTWMANIKCVNYK